jgi:hypothetical protein
MNWENVIETAPISLLNLLKETSKIYERPDYHPEESTRVHIEVVTRRLEVTNDPDLIMAGFIHDLGKWPHNQKGAGKDGWPTAPGHANYARALVENNQDIWDWIKSWGANPQVVAEISGHHMKIKNFDSEKPKRQRKMKNQVSPKSWIKLQVFTEADNMLRPFYYEGVSNEKAEVLLSISSKQRFL